MDESENNYKRDVEILRKKFEESCDQELLEQFEESDVERFRKDDRYCESFLIHHEGDINNALNMVKESFKWRKEFGVHNLKESNVSSDLLKLGIMFQYNHDKDDNPILMMIVKRYKKDSKMTSEQKRLLVFCVEKCVQQSRNNSLTMIFDFQGAGYSSVDFEMALFGTNLFLKYYPLLGHMLLYDMPRIFDVLWKLIKPIVPKHLRRKVVFVNKESIKQYVDDKCLPVKMGGEDSSEYVYTPAA